MKKAESAKISQAENASKREIKGIAYLMISQFCNIFSYLYLAREMHTAKSPVIVSWAGSVPWEV